MTAAVIYARISKDGAGEHLGVDRQERLCRDLADTAGLTVVDVLVDNDVSAYARKPRPAFERLVDMLRAGEAGAVVTYHADRLYRRTTDLERLVDLVEASGAQVRTVSAGSVDLTTASGRMVARMLGVAAQHESERMGERVRAKNDELAASGKPPGGRPPYGYGAGYTVEPTEAEAVRYMARRILEGASLLGLARELDARGVTTREGRPWHHASVRATLHNPAIAGLRVHRREVAGLGNWQPILDRQTWEEVRAVIADPSRKRTRPPQRYLLSGMVTNPAGDAMAGRPDKGAGGTTDRRCYATRAPARPSLSIGADELEELVTEAVLIALDEAKLPIPEPTEVAGAVEELEAELAQLAALRGEGSISLAEWLAARTPLLDRLEAARAEAGTVRRPSAELVSLSGPGAARRAWPTLDLATRREVIGTVVDRVVIGPASRGRWTPAADRVEIVWKV